MNLVGNRHRYKDEYDKIWNKILLPIILMYSRNYGVKHKPISFLKKIIYNYYNNYRDIFLKRYMTYGVVDIDRHKIAACFLKCILEIKPLYIPLSAKIKIIFSNKEIHQILGVYDNQLSNRDLNNRIYYINEYIALSIAMSIINSYIEKDSGKPLKHTLIVPDPFPKNTPDYILDICINLHFCKKKSFDLATLSNLFFLWEKYSCRRVQCENLEKELKSLYIYNKSFDDLSDQERDNLSTLITDDLLEKINQIRLHDQKKGASD